MSADPRSRGSAGAGPHPRRVHDRGRSRRRPRRRPRL